MIGKNIKVAIIFICILTLNISDFFASLTNSQSVTSLFTSVMPTHSINEQNIELIYGKSGLNLSENDILCIKQTYSYIETVVKSFKIKQNPQLQKLFSKYYTSDKSSSVISQDILQSKEWQSIAITQDDIVNSELWQLYIKSVVVDYYDNQCDFIESITMTQNQMFPYLANIELNFYNNDFMSLHSFAQLLRIEKVLQDQVCLRSLAQSIDWKGKNVVDLIDEIKQFKETDFYKYTHNSALWSSDQSKISHPLQEYIMSFLMLVSIQSIVEKNIPHNNIISFLKQASSVLIKPNFFPYQDIDAFCFQDIFRLQDQLVMYQNNQSKDAQKNIESFNIKDLIDATQVKNLGNTQNVVIQKISLGSVTHAVSHAGDSVSHTVTQTVDEGAKVADEAKQEADRKAKEAKQEAERQAKAAQEEAERQAKAAQEEAERQAKAAEEEAERQAKAAQEEAERQAKAIKEEAERQAKAAQQAYEKATKDIQKIAQQAAQAAAKIAQEKAVQQAAKAAQSAALAAAQAAISGATALSGNTLVEIGTVAQDQSIKQEGQKEKEASKDAAEQAKKDSQKAAIQSGDAVKTAANQTVDVIETGAQKAGQASEKIVQAETDKAVQSQVGQQISNQVSQAEKDVKKSEQGFNQGVQAVENAPITHQLESIKAKDFVSAEQAVEKEGDKIAANKDFSNAVDQTVKGLNTAEKEINKGYDQSVDYIISTEKSVEKNMNQEANQDFVAAEKGFNQTSKQALQGADKGLTTAGQAITQEGTKDFKKSEAGLTTAGQAIAQEGAKDVKTSEKGIVKTGESAGKELEQFGDQVGQEAEKIGNTINYTVQGAGLDASGKVLTGVGSGISTITAGAESSSGKGLTGIGSAVSTVSKGAEVASGDILTGVGSTVSTVSKGAESSSGKGLTGVGSAVSTVSKGAEVTSGKGLTEVGSAVSTASKGAEVASGKGLTGAGSAVSTASKGAEVTSGKGLTGAGSAVSTASKGAEVASGNVLATTGQAISSAAPGMESLSGEVLTEVGKNVAHVTGDNTIEKEGEREKSGDDLAYAGDVLSKEGAREKSGDDLAHTGDVISKEGAREKSGDDVANVGSAISKEGEREKSGDDLAHTGDVISKEGKREQSGDDLAHTGNVISKEGKREQSGDDVVNAGSAISKEGEREKSGDDLASIGSTISKEGEREKTSAKDDTALASKAISNKGHEQQQQAREDYQRANYQNLGNDINTVLQGADKGLTTAGQAITQEGTKDFKKSEAGLTTAGQAIAQEGAKDVKTSEKGIVKTGESAGKELEQFGDQVGQEAEKIGNTINYTVQGAGLDASGKVLTGVGSGISTITAGAESSSGKGLTGIGSAVSTITAGAESSSGKGLTGIGSAVSTVSKGAEVASGDILTGVGSTVSTVSKGAEVASGSILTGVGSAVSTASKGAEVASGKGLTEVGSAVSTASKGAEVVSGNVLATTGQAISSAAPGMESLSGEVLIEVGKNVAHVTGDNTIEKEGEREKSGDDLADAGDVISKEGAREKSGDDVANVGSAISKEGEREKSGDDLAHTGNVISKEGAREKSGDDLAHTGNVISKEGKREQSGDDVANAGSAISKEGEREKSGDDLASIGSTISKEGEREKTSAKDDTALASKAISNKGHEQQQQAREDYQRANYQNLEEDITKASNVIASTVVSTSDQIASGISDIGLQTEQSVKKTTLQGTNQLVNTASDVIEGTSKVGQNIAQTVTETTTQGIKEGKSIAQNISQTAINTTSDVIQGTKKTAQDSITTGINVANQAQNAPEKIKDTSINILKSSEQELQQTEKATEDDIVGHTSAQDFVNVGKSASSVAEHGGKAILQGASAGVALAVGSELGIDSVTKWGNKQAKQSLQNLQQTNTAFNNTIKNLASFGLLGPIVYGLQGVVVGAAGLDATLLGDIVYAQTGSKAIKNWGKKESDHAVNLVKAASDSLNNIIASVSSVIEDGIIAPIAIFYGTEMALITQNKQMGQDLTFILNQIADSVVNIGETALVSVNNFMTNYAVQVYTLTEDVYELLEDSLLMVYGEVTNQKDVKRRSVQISSSNTKKLINDGIKAVSQTLTCVTTAGMNILMSVVESLATIENSLTTVVFDLVEEITFLGASIAELAGAHVNPQLERNHIQAKMEAHRGTINIVMSVVLTVALTVATMGAAAPEAAAIIGAEVGGEAAASGVIIGADVAGEAATESVALAVDSAETLATSTTEDLLAENMVEEGAKAGSEQSAKAGSEQGAKAGSEQSAKAGSEEATNNLTDAELKAAEQQGSSLMTYAADFIGQAINIVFSVFGIIAADNKDETAARTLEIEKQSIMNMWKTVENNKVVMIQNQNIYLDELNKKHEVAIMNQNFGLNYYINYLNNSVNNMQRQISHALADQYSSLLTVDDTGSHLADIGYSWGLKTPFIYLYPSQGFLTTTLGRKNFKYAQEIAQAPQSSLDADQKSSSIKDADQQKSVFWFNQRAVCTLDQSVTNPLHVEVKFRVIYNLDTEFHLGIYIGGKFYDYNSSDYLQDIKNTGEVHLDDAHLAKMFVFKRDIGEKQVSLGVYEHEGKGWIFNKPLDSNFKRTTVCHMSALLDHNKLTVALWPEDQPNKKWTNTFEVTPCDQKTYGIIFSGAALEWDVVDPVQQVVENSKVRQKTTTPLEADREKASKKAWKKVKNPDFGSIHLTSLGKKYIFQGQYIYTTMSTPLKDKDGKQLTDIVAFATYVGSTCTNIGSNPTPEDSSKTPNSIISMINGDIYDNTGKVIGNQKDPWTLFVQNNGPFDQNLIDTVETTKKACPEKPVAVSAQTISFNSFNNDPAPSFGGFQFGLSSFADSSSSQESFDDLQMDAAGGFSFDFGDFGDAF